MSAVFLHGGGDSPEARSIAFGRFAQSYLTNVHGPLLIVATDDDAAEAEAIAAYYRDLFATMDVPAGWLVPLIVGPERPLTGEQVAVLAPSGLFVCGGSTPRYHQALCSDLSWIDYLRQNAVPYGGTSAGAAIAADRAIIGGWQVGEETPRPILAADASEGIDPLTVRPGAGLVPFAVDVHAGQWGTLTRLIHAVESGLVKEGWAIDEDTLLAVHPTRIQIYGRGYAYRVVRAAAGRVTVRLFAAPDLYRRR
mgnify:CR=1 FL=1